MMAGSTACAREWVLKAVVAVLLSAPAVQAAELALAWSAPDFNTDGTPVTGPLSYTVCYGLSSGVYTQETGSDGATSATIKELEDGATHYFAVKACCGTGIESDLSAELVWTAPVNEPPEPPPPPPDPQYFILLVGISDYPGKDNDLTYAGNDVKDVGAALLSYANWDYGNGVLLLDGKASAYSIMNEIEGLGQRMQAADTFVLYFSGRGSNASDLPPLDETDGRDEYLCAYDRDVSDDELSGWLSNLPCTNILVMLDTCYTPATQKLPGNCRSKCSVGTVGVPMDGDGFAADLARLNGTVVLSAAAPEEQALEVPRARNGLFSYFVAEGISAFMDLNANGVLSIEEVFAYVLSRPYFEQLGQHPQLLVDGSAPMLCLP